MIAAKPDHNIVVANGQTIATNMKVTAARISKKLICFSSVVWWCSPVIASYVYRRRPIAFLNELPCAEP
ncbi:MAG: hypothetical protein AAFR88_08075, partial [Pseudomonadota bacterium]